MTVQVEIPTLASAPGVARAVVRRLDGTLDPQLVPDVALLVSELVTNSVKYGRGPVRVEIDAPVSRRVSVQVVDQGPGFAATPRDRPLTEPGRWGLHLVEQLADRWGIHERPTHVWFEIDRD